MKKVSFCHYADLFRKGYSQQEIDDFFNGKYYEVLFAGKNKMVLLALMLERKIVAGAYREYCDNPEMESLEQMYNDREFNVINYDFIDNLSRPKLRIKRY